MIQSATSSSALVARSLPSGAARLPLSILVVLAGTALLTVAAKVTVPFLPVPMTLQTFAVFLIAATCGFRLGTLTLIAYLAEGLLGLPVFTNTPPLAAGPGYFLGPTGGFLVGFVVAAALVGLAADRGAARSPFLLFGVMLAGELAIMAIGYVWLAWFALLSNGDSGLGTAAAFSAGVAPFILGDLLKLALAALVVSAATSRRTPKMRSDEGKQA